MVSLEFMVPRAESEAFNTAVYRFLELKSAAADDGFSMLQSDPSGPLDRKRVTLWSEAALTDFTAFWTTFRASLKPVHEGWRRPGIAPSGPEVKGLA